MSGDIAVRRVFADDWRLFAGVRLAALREAPQAYFSRYEAWVNASEEQWRGRLTSVAGNWVALRGEDAVGLIGGSLPEPTRVHLLSMWVAPSARGQGVGDQLVTTVVEWARSQPGVEVVELKVFEGNPSAQKLYQRNGFVFSTPETGDPKHDRPMVLGL